MSLYRATNVTVGLTSSGSDSRYPVFSQASIREGAIQLLLGRRLAPIQGIQVTGEGRSKRVALIHFVRRYLLTSRRWSASGGI